jgi:phosphoribosylglycinamide formyltransferase-1
VRRLGILASGSGTILQALLDEDLPVAVVVVDRACGATERAEAAGVPVELVQRESFGADFDRAAYTERVVDVLKRHEVDLVAMAGFMTILDQPIHDAYGARITNTHPSLLPAFQGARAVADALAAGVKVTGCTVHLATLAVDEGPILAQEAVPVLPDDTAESLHERIKGVERRLYPRVLRDLVHEPNESGERSEPREQEDA